MDTSSIKIRYAALAEETCCLSCGGAVNHAKPQPGEYCIDLGSGRGTDVLRMAEDVGEKGFVFGVDVTDAMLETARRNAQKLGVENVNFMKADLEAIPIPSGTADLIISNCTINHATNKLRVWSEVYRLLKSGGRFVVSDIYAVTPIAEEYRNDPVAVSECWAGAVTREEYMQTLEKAGFKHIEVLEESKPYPKGKAEVVSFTIFGLKDKKCSCCS
jgi:arsenite methyltransferase